MDPWASPWADKSTDDAPQPAPPLSQAEAGPSSSSSSSIPPPTSHSVDAYDHDPWASSSSPVKEEQSPSDQGIAGDAAVSRRDSQPWRSSEKQSPDELAAPPSLSLSSSGLGASTDAAEAAGWLPTAPDSASVDLNDPDADPWADPATKAALAAKAPRDDDIPEKPVQPSTTVSPDSRHSNAGAAPPQFVFNPDGSLYRPPTEAESEESAGAATSQSVVTDGKPVSASPLASMTPSKVQQQPQQQQRTKDTKQPPTKSEDPANITSGPGWQMAKPSATKVLAGRFSGWVSNAVARGREGPTVESAADGDGDSGDESNQKDDVLGGSAMSAAPSSKGPSQNILDEPAQASEGTNDAAGSNSQGGFWSRWRRGANTATDSQSQQPPANTIDSDGLDWLSSQSAPAAASSSSQMRSSSSGSGGGGKYSDEHGQGSSMPPPATFGKPAPTNDPFDFSMFEAPLGGTKQSTAPSSTAARAKSLAQPPRRETGPPQAFLSGRAEETEDFDSIGYDYRDGDGDDSDLRAAESDLRGMGDLDWMDSGRYTDRLTPKKPMSRQQNRAAHAQAPVNASPPPAMQSYRSSAEETRRPFSPSLGTITLNRSGSTTSSTASRNRVSGTASSSARGSATSFQLPPPPSSSSSSSSSPSFPSQRPQQKQQPNALFDFSSSSSPAPPKQATGTAPRSSPLFPPPPGSSVSRHSPMSSPGMQTSQSQQQEQQKRKQAAISQGQTMTQDDLAFFEGL